MVKRKNTISTKERARRSRQAKINFGHSKTKLKRSKKVAKRKATKKRSTSKSMKIFGVNVGKMLAPVLYGMGRTKVSNRLAPYTSKLPLGSVSDEAGMYLAMYGMKKYFAKKAGLVRDVLTVGQNIELVRIGDAVINEGIGLPFVSGPATSSTNIF